MASNRAIWYVSGAKKAARNSGGGTLYIRCNVKPGANRCREGVASVSDEAVGICVAAQAREGEANKAVVKVLSEVLDLPKSDLQITQGLKSRNKTIAVAVAVASSSSEEECVRQVKAHLEKAMGDS
ncbi:hypothetical protein B0T17DRAFT_532619 [Bombardia bombarda]|uniref:YggU-like protein n=1 Tax=Bombardia bombarda TaxID=252184 RepID=A0AA39X151_9PEZI|nr:hypothetical protein B0T17DRAFT_532619 [Bombardia bombarda]